MSTEVHSRRTLAATIASNALSAGWLAIAAVVVALTFRGLHGLGLLPRFASYLDLPIAWAALAIALARRRPRTRLATRSLIWLGALALAVGLSFLAHPSELARPLVYLAILGEPFALLTALLLDPPSPPTRKVMTFTLAGLVAVQAPIALAQGLFVGWKDPVQGTLYTSGSGAHAMAGIVALGAMWLLGARRLSFGYRVAGAAGLLGLAIGAGAKGVVFSLVAILLIPPRGMDRRVLIARGALILATVATLLLFTPQGDSSVKFIGQAGSARIGKIPVIGFLTGELAREPLSILVGKGPAETVTRTAFLTTPLLAKEGSPLRALHLHPARLALAAQRRALPPEFVTIRRGLGALGYTTFNSALSSGLGVAGDLGLLGAVAYGGLLLTLILALRARRSPEAHAALAGWAMFVILGFAFGWWEDPPFSVFLATLSGLALTDPRPDAVMVRPIPRADPISVPR